MRDQGTRRETDGSAGEKRYLDDAARVLVLWMRGGCRGDIHAAIAETRAKHGAAAEAVHARAK